MAAMKETHMKARNDLSPFGSHTTSGYPNPFNNLRIFDIFKIYGNYNAD
jgi:hypothetical protein